MRAALEAEMRKVHVGDVLLQTVVSLINIGARRTGTVAGTEPERDLDQVRLAVDAVNALLPSIDAVAADQAPAIRDALAQLKLAYAKAGGTPPTDAGEQGGPSAGGDEPTEQPPSRLWVPGR